MANKLDRESAKKSISSKETNDPELDEALRAAKDFQLDILKENNRHVEETHKANLGWFGRAFGGDASAPTYVALIAMMVGIVGAGLSLYMAAKAPGDGEFWGKQFERLIAFASAALAFIFGRGSAK
jgi:hypothetical protein